MNKHLSFGLLMLPGVALGQALPEASPVPPPDNTYRNWPVVAAVQFHTLAMPLSDWSTPLANVGVSLGTEFRYNRRATLLQSLPVGYYRNRNVGGGLFFAPQFMYRPRLGAFFAELKAGVGALYTFQPSQSLALQDGRWQAADHGGKLTLMLPLGVSVGYSGAAAAPRLAPFVSYQFFVQHGYNPGLPLIPNRLLQVGIRSHLFRY